MMAMKAKHEFEAKISKFFIGQLRSLQRLVNTKSHEAPYLGYKLMLKLLEFFVESQASYEPAACLGFVRKSRRRALDLL